VSLPASPTANRLIKPTLKTKFHIDFDWWERESREFRVYLTSHLCAEHQAAVGEIGNEVVDVVDAETAEVRREDGIQHLLRVHCSKLPDFITTHTSLVDAVFRVFIANANQPLSPEELADRIGRPGPVAANTILRTLSGARVYKGLRPVY
jgi:hypothetical protein